MKGLVLAIALAASSCNMLYYEFTIFGSTTTDGDLDQEGATRFDWNEDRVGAAFTVGISPAQDKLVAAAERTAYASERTALANDPLFQPKKDAVPVVVINHEDDSDSNDEQQSARDTSGEEEKSLKELVITVIGLALAGLAILFRDFIVRNTVGRFKGKTDDSSEIS